MALFAAMWSLPHAAGMDTVATILQEECAFLFQPKKST
jgi:hypothetical protein